jgi:crotonobetainyl-CoA hydratase
MDAAQRWAKMICECAPLSIRASKDVVYKSLDSASLQDAMEAKYDTVMEMVGSLDFIEGPKAFSEKRAPNWQGK